VRVYQFHHIRVVEEPNELADNLRSLGSGGPSMPWQKCRGQGQNAVISM